MKSSKPRKASTGDLKLDEFLCYAIYSAGHALNRFYKPLLSEIGLTYPQYLTMVVVWEGDEHTVGSIAERLSLESHSLTPILKRLETMSLIRRTRDVTDERQVRVALTAKGNALREKAQGVPGCLRAAVGLSDPDIRRLRQALQTVRDAVESGRTSLAPSRLPRKTPLPTADRPQRERKRPS